MLHYLRIGSRITITQMHMHTMQQTHTHKAVTGRVEAKKLPLLKAIKSIVKKVNSRLKFLYRQANYFNEKVKKMICSALMFCLFDFSISAWYGGISKYHAHRLQCAQNKVIRFILNKDFILTMRISNLWAL